MKMDISGKLRKLRKQAGYTQGQLAEKLNISSQAVSKWENGIAYPDLPFLPILAEIFDVSIDELFDYDSELMQRKVADIIEDAGQYFLNNPVLCKDILRTGLKRYPNNDKLLTELLALYEYRLNNNERCVSLEEAEKIAEIVITRSNDFLCICRTKATLASIYLIENKYNKARDMVQSLPKMYPFELNDKMRCSAQILHGKDRLEGASEWKIIEIQELFLSCGFEGEGFWETEQYESAVRSFRQASAVIEVFLKSEEISEETYLWSGMQTHHWAYILGEAGALAKLGSLDECRKKIQKARHIISNAWTDFDTQQERYMTEFKRLYKKYDLDVVVP